MTQSIYDFFNPHSLDHIVAYKHLSDTGSWPAGFIPGGTQFPSGWHFMVLAKMADAWVDQVMKGKIEGIPAYEGTEK